MRPDSGVEKPYYKIDVFHKPTKKMDLHWASNKHGQYPKNYFARHFGYTTE